MRPVHALPAIAAVSVIGGYLYIGWTGGEREQRPVYRNDHGEIVGHPTFDTTVERVRFAGDYFGSGRSRMTEWRVYDEKALGWSRFIGPRWKFEQTPGAVLVGDLP